MTDEAQHVAQAAAAMDDRNSNRFEECDMMITRQDIARQLRASAEALEAGASLEITRQLLSEAMERFDRMAAEMDRLRTAARRDRMARAAQKAQNR